MLDFDLSEDQVILQKMVRDFAEQNVAPIAQQLDEDEAFDQDLVRKMGELGCYQLGESKSIE